MFLRRQMTHTCLIHVEEERGAFKKISQANFGLVLLWTKKNPRTIGNSSVLERE